MLRRGSQVGSVYWIFRKGNVMPLKHVAAFLMLLCALGCQPSDSGTDASGDGDATTAPAADDTAVDAATADDEQLTQVSFNVEGMK